MKNLNLIMQVFIICITISSCKKETVSPQQSNTMKQIFYTEEGKGYVLKTATRNQRGVVYVNPSTVISPNVRINWPTSPGNGELSFNTTKKIIPVQYNLSVTASTTATVFVDIGSVYYSAVVGSTDFCYDAQKSQAKLYSLVDRVYFTSNAFYGYNLRYGQVVFNDGDFIDPGTSLVIGWTPDKAESLAMMAFNTTLPTLAAGTYNIAVTFTYFEML